MKRLCQFGVLFLSCQLPFAAQPTVSGGQAPDLNRLVRVVTISQDLLREPRLAEKTIARLQQAAVVQPDIVCLPELFSGELAEAVPGPATDRLAQWARAHGSYVLFGLKTKTGERTYNSAILIDRRGRVIGQYNKIHPTEREIAEGTEPGEPKDPVFETDFGTIGVQICFDVNWWDAWARLKRKGAQIVCFLSAYPAATQLSMLALMNQFYVVSSTESGSSRIYDITGRVLALSGGHQQWAFAVLPLGKRLFETDFNVGKAQAARQKYGDKVELFWYHNDDWFTLASVDPKLTTEAVIAEFGLTPLDDYRVRATRAVEEARKRAVRQTDR